MENYFVVDSHYDLGPMLFNRHQRDEKEIIKNHLLKSWKRNNVKLIVGAIFIDDIFLPEQALKIALDQIALISKEVDALDDLVLVKSKEDLNQIFKNEQIGIMLSLEGLEPIGNDLKLIDIFYDLGVRAAGLTWSRGNAVAEGSRFNNTESQNGLSTYGIEVIKKMHEKGILVDISHLNDAGIKDLNGRIFASHSNARAIHAITRNLKDDHIIKITSCDGIIGINGIKPIVGGDKNIESMCEHIMYIKNLVGSERICLGLDLCTDLEITGIRFGNEEIVSIDTVNGYDDIHLLIQELQKRDFSEEEIRGILGTNFIKFVQEALK